MATFKAVILKQQLRLDGTYPLQIRICNNRKIGYLNTGWYVKESDFDELKNLKNIRTRNAVDAKILELENEFKEKFGLLSKVNGTTLATYFLKKAVDDIDFVAYYKQFIQKMYAAGRSENSISNYKVALHHFLGFIKKDHISIHEVTANFIKRYMDFLNNKTGKRAVSLALSCLRKVFNEVIKEYNDEENDVIVVKHYPFKFIKIKSPVSTKKRSVDANVVRMLLRYDNLVNKRDIFARDIFALSFYLGGINATDLYYLKPENIVRGRLEYNRRKTESTREDSAFMSILIPEEAKPIMTKYFDPENERLFDFYHRYAKEKYFVKGVNKGLQHICELLNLPRCTSYTARHTIAYIAKNDLHFPLDEVAILLNHSNKLKMTEIYTTRNYEIADRVEKAVIDYVISKKRQSEISKNKQYFLA